MEMKKISFGFSKSVRKGPLMAGPSAIGVREKDERDKIELISCVEEQSIRVVGKENGDGEVKDLVIPLREQDKTTVPGRLAKLQEIKEDRGQGGVVVAGEKRVETLEQKAAREIMEELRERQDNFGKEDNFVVPLKPEDLPLEGARESTLDDYEAIPIESFGMAMLRGMGFKEDPAKKKDKDDKLLPEGPMMRPKGLGLGAERAPKDASKQLIPPAKDEVLAMRNGAFVKVLTGRQKNAYGTDLTPKDIRLIDWQLSRYVSPILDLSYFIFICTDEDFRANHFDQLLDCYYESLSEHLKKLGGDAERQFPRATFQDHWKRFGRFGLLMGLIVLPIVCTAKEELPEMEDYIDRAEQQQDAEFNFGTSEQAQEMYRTRMAGMIRDVVRLGYL